MDKYGNSGSCKVGGFGEVFAVSFVASGVFFDKRSGPS
jgi:hypothetical protein